MSGSRFLRSQYSSTAAHSAIAMMDTASALCVNFCDGLTVGVRLLQGEALVPNDRKVEVRQMVEETMNLVRFGCGTASGIDPTAIVRQEVPDCIVTDGSFVQRNVLHLMSNACKYTTEGQVHLDVSVQEPGQEGGTPMVRFEVSDTGQGI